MPYRMIWTWLRKSSEAFYRIKDFRKQVSIVPVSARYGVGIPELLAVLIGLAQQFLTTKLSQGAGDISGRSKGIVLELQEEVGMGQTANIILTDGTLHVGDRIVIVKRDGAAQTKVKALFMPKPLDEMRDPRDKFTAVNEVYAAAGVKLVSQCSEGNELATPGEPPIAACNRAQPGRFNFRSYTRTGIQPALSFNAPLERPDLAC